MPSSPTVQSLCRDLGAHLRPAPGFRAPATRISAVHISELLDPTDYLNGGELLLTTGLSMPANKIGCDRYVSRLVAAEVAALAFGLGPTHAAVPPHLDDACRRQGLALLVVPPPTPFLTITKAYWSTVNRSSEQHLHDVLAAQRAIVDAAASEDPVGRVLRTLSRSLDAWAATYSPDAQAEQVHPQRAAAQARAASSAIARLEGAGVHSSASFSSGSASVIVVPLAAEDRVTGYLAVGTPTPLDQPRRRAVLTASALLSLEAVRRATARSVGEERARCVAELVGIGHLEAARDLAGSWGLPAPAPRGRVLAMGGRELARGIEAVRAWRPEATVLHDAVTAWSWLPDTVDPADRDDLDRRLPDSVAAEVSDPIALAEVPRVLSRIRSAAATAPAGSRRWGRQSPYDDSHATRAETALLALPTPLREAAVAYLRHRGQWEAAARELGVHRNTLRNRLGERLTHATEGAVTVADLDDPDLAAHLWLALRRHGHA